MMTMMIDTTTGSTNVDTDERQHRPSGVKERRVVRQPRSRRRCLLVHQNNIHHIGIITPSSTPLVFVRQLLLVFVWGGLTLVAGQFNEPPGQRREQTYRVLEFEASNINQHYPGDLRYYCTFRGKWSAERHPHDFPASPSFSAPVLVSHTKNYRMWTGTETVTAGVEYLAEEGYPTVMYQEFENAGFESLQMIVGERMFNTTATQHLPPINVTYSHPWLSAMTKITPSPDWFVGFSDLRTISYDTETYYNQFVIQSYVWDAGTDEGQSYLAFDRDLDPQEPCMRLCVPPNLGQGGSGTADTNIVHKHPNGNNKPCPDRDKGRTAIPTGTKPFVDYTLSYIPYPAEYECVLRVGDGEVYAGNAFNESQIRPPKYIARPDDDYLDGISPYDQPRYDEYVEELELAAVLERIPEDMRDSDGVNLNWLWLIVGIILAVSLGCCVAVYLCLLSHSTSTKKKVQKLTEDMDDDQDADAYDGPDLFYNQKDDEGNPMFNSIASQGYPQGTGNRKNTEEEHYFDDFDGTAPYNDGTTNRHRNGENEDDPYFYDATLDNTTGNTAVNADDDDYERYLASQRDDGDYKPASSTSSTGYRDIL